MTQLTIPGEDPRRRRRGPNPERLPGPCRGAKRANRRTARGLSSLSTTPRADDRYYMNNEGGADLALVRHELEVLSFARTTWGLRDRDARRYEELCEIEREILGSPALV